MRRILLTVLFLTAFCGSIFPDSGGILECCNKRLRFDKLLAVSSVMAQERLAEEPATGWSTPTILYPEVWPDPLYFSVSDNGARLVALLPASGSDDNSRHIVTSELIGGVWQEPVVIAQNGAYSEALVPGASAAHPSRHQRRRQNNCVCGLHRRHLRRLCFRPDQRWRLGPTGTFEHRAGKHPLLDQPEPRTATPWPSATIRFLGPNTFTC